jgi:hypothetical protein
MARLTVPITLSIALQGGAGALVGVIVGLILHGDLLTARMMDRISSAFEKRLAEKDEQIRLWRDAHDTVKKANDALIVQLYQSLEIGRTASSVLGAVAEHPSPGGQNDPHVVA